MSHIKIIQERSQIRCLKKHKRTLFALGLHHPRHSVVHRDTPQIRGMVAQVSYLVRVEPVDGAAMDAAGAEKAAAKAARKKPAAKKAAAKKAAPKRAAGTARAAKKAAPRRAES
jgi:large subunit ribosomal protein L30